MLHSIRVVCTVCERASASGRLPPPCGIQRRSGVQRVAGAGVAQGRLGPRPAAGAADAVRGACRCGCARSTRRRRTLRWTRIPPGPCPRCAGWYKWIYLMCSRRGPTARSRGLSSFASRGGCLRRCKWVPICMCVLELCSGSRCVWFDVTSANSRQSPGRVLHCCAGQRRPPRAWLVIAMVPPCGCCILQGCAYLGAPLLPRRAAQCRLKGRRPAPSQREHLPVPVLSCHSISTSLVIALIYIP